MKPATGYLQRVPQIPDHLLAQIGHGKNPPAAIAAQVDTRIRLCKLAARLARELFLVTGGRIK